MSKTQSEIIVDFNTIKQEIKHEVTEEVKPKAKRASKKIILSLKMLINQLNQLRML